MKVNTDSKKIKEVLTRSIAYILPTKEDFERLLLSGKQKKIYLGVDPTGPALHLGHATNYMVLERFRQLGHKVIILIGDFTARIGDPTDRSAARIRLNRDQIEKNVKTWLTQISPLIDLKNKENPPEIVYNHDWLSKLTFEDVVDLASNFTVQQMLERDMFEKRIAEEKPIHLHELFYPLMQGYDSVVLDVDAELCGTDQTFNALAGRTLLKRLKNKEKFIITTTLLENPKTKEKMMSKSKGTGVYLNESAENMFGGIMAQPDENIPQLFTDCTYIPLDEIEKIKKQLEKGSVNPRDIKADLAKEIVKIYHGEKTAQKAEKEFDRVFKEKELPSEIDAVELPEGEYNILDLLVKTKMAPSKAEAKRLVLQGAIKINGQVEKDWQKNMETVKGQETIIQSGKRKFIKIQS
jgi:tyrosyl-tRNA synthetase